MDIGMVDMGQLWDSCSDRRRHEARRVSWARKKCYVISSQGYQICKVPKKFLFLSSNTLVSNGGFV